MGGRLLRLLLPLQDETGYMISQRCGLGSVGKALDFRWFHEVEGSNPARVIFVSAPQRMGVG